MNVSILELGHYCCYYSHYLMLHYYFFNVVLTVTWHRSISQLIITFEFMLMWTLYNLCQIPSEWPYLYPSAVTSCFNFLHAVGLAMHMGSPPLPVHGCPSLALQHPCRGYPTVMLQQLYDLESGRQIVNSCVFRWKYRGAERKSDS